MAERDGRNATNKKGIYLHNIKYKAIERFDLCRKTVAGLSKA